MARKKICLGSRGPSRATGSKVKIRCAYHKCKSLQDCKNVGTGLQLRRARACLNNCRKSLRADAQLLKFCCRRHLEQCKLAAPKHHKRGPREVLSPDQIVHLLRVLCQDGAPWAAVAALLQLTVAERGSCIMHCRFRWLQHLGPDSAGVPAIDIEQVNKKTVARHVPIPGQLARLLHCWMHERPLQGNNSQWPFQGQGCEPDAFLFPSANVQGERNWNRCMTRQAFHLRLQRACKIIQQERTVLRRQRMKSPPFKHAFKDMDMSKLGSYSFKRSAQVFDCVDLSNIGTHSLKRSSITLLKQKCTSAAVLQSISGTAPRTLDRYYDQPTTARQLEALDETFQGIWGPLEKQEPSSDAKAPDRGQDTYLFCPRCGKKRADLAWAVCPWCGWHFPHVGELAPGTAKSSLRPEARAACGC